MSPGDEDEQLKFPSVGDKISWLGYHVRVEFHPSIKISTRGGHDFAAAIHSAMEVGASDVDGNQWILRGARAYDGMKVAVGRQSLVMSATEPTNFQDWYEQRFTAILEAFSKTFDPKVILSASAMGHGLIDVTGDARFFLAGNLMLMQPKKLDAFQRQLHVLGVRLYFPPCDEEGEGEAADWGVDVKAESWMDDPTKLYLEADADWYDSTQWEEDGPQKIVAHLKMVTDFMNTRLLTFLHQPPFLIDDDEDEEGEGDG